MTGVWRFLLAAVALAVPTVALAASYHHVQIIAASPSEAVRWYARHLDCQPLSDRNDTADCATESN